MFRDLAVNDRVLEKQTPQEQATTKKGQMKAMSRRGPMAPCAEIASQASNRSCVIFPMANLSWGVEDLVTEAVQILQL